jgi:hypothetical protein
VAASCLSQRLVSGDEWFEPCAVTDFAGIDVGKHAAGIDQESLSEKILMQH